VLNESAGTSERCEYSPVKLTKGGPEAPLADNNWIIIDKKFLVDD